MAQTYSQFKTSVLTKLADTASTNFNSTEMDTFISDAFRESAQYVPHIFKVSYYIESRTGTATSTSANNLVDATEAQFLSTDVGKDVYNTTTKTWTKITSYTSSSQVGLSDNAFTSGDNYKIFNSGCSSNKEVNISNVLSDYIAVDSVEFPVGTRRNWELEGDILRIKVDSVPDSKVASSGTQPNTEVVVRFRRRHLVSQLTDLSATVANSAGYSAAATAIALSSLQSSGTIEAGQEFTIANVRGVYSVTDNAAISSNTAAVSFYPGLASSIANSVVVTFKQSTLTPTLEPLVQDLSAALAGVSKPMSLYQLAFTSISDVGLAATAIALITARVNAATADVTSAHSALTAGTTAIANMATLFSAATGDVALARTALNASTVAIAAMTARIAAATADVTSGLAYAATAGTSSIASATTEIAKIVTEVTLAASALASGTSLINTIPIGGGAAEWMGQANGDIGVAQGRIANGQTWLQKAASELTIANSYYTAANLEFKGASEYGSQAGSDVTSANGYLNSAGLDLRVAQERVQEAQANHANAAQYLNSAATELRAASERAEEGNTNLKKATVYLQISASGRTLEAYARANLLDVRNRLKAVSGHTYSKRYHQD